jgi:hypothetical protein
MADGNFLISSGKINSYLSGFPLTACGDDGLSERDIRGKSLFDLKFVY